VFSYTQGLIEPCVQYLTPDLYVKIYTKEACSQLLAEESARLHVVLVNPVKTTLFAAFLDQNRLHVDSVV